MENFFSNAQEGRRERKRKTVFRFPNLDISRDHQSSNESGRIESVGERKREKKKIERRCDRYFCLDSCAKTFKSNDLNEQANQFSLFYTRTAVTINTRVFLNEE